MRRDNTACHNVAEWLSEIVFCSTSYALIENIIWCQLQIWHGGGVRKCHDICKQLPVTCQKVLAEYFVNSFTLPWKVQHWTRHTLQPTVKHIAGSLSNLLYFWSHFSQGKVSHKHRISKGKICLANCTWKKTISPNLKKQKQNPFNFVKITLKKNIFKFLSSKVVFFS